MKRKKDLEKVWRELCADLDADDGVTQDELKRKSDKPAHSGATRSTLRLCAQVHRAIDLSLAAECADPDLHGLRVASVVPYPDARRLRVHLCASAEIDAPDYALLNRKVAAVQHLLAHAAAASVHRKRAPRLVFLIAPDSASESEVRDA